MWENDNSIDAAPILSQGDNVVRTTVLGGGTRPAASKCLRDPVHDNITLHPLLVAIVDTPQFQRLRTVAQLGVVSLLFPGAVHTRFEHSVGTSHLATKMARHLQSLHNDVTDEDVLCVGIAGLCHDLGHGPYSHLFEKYVNANRSRQGRTPWHHEETSIKLFRYLIAKNEIPIGDYNLGDPDINFICALICGLKPRDAWLTDIGRPETKRFLFDIVSNKRNGVDVDKLDYFLRDSLHCYGRLPVDVNIDRIIHSSRALVCDGQYQVCYEEKVALSLQDVFRLRAQLHKYCYQHRVVLILQRMVLDTLMAVGDNFKVLGTKLYDTVDNMAIYSTMGDWILNAIVATECPELQKARDIHERMVKRELYQYVSHAVVRTALNLCSETQLMPYLAKEVSRDDFFLVTAHISYASERNEQGSVEDPLNHVRFFNPKECVLSAHTVRGRQLGGLFSPAELEEITVFVCVRNIEIGPQVAAAFEQWKKRRSDDDFVVTRGNVNSPARQGSASVKKRLRPTASNDDFGGSQGMLTPNGKSTPGTPVQ